MGAPIQGKGNRRGYTYNNIERNGFGKPRQLLSRRPLNVNYKPFDNQVMMRPRGPFPPNRGGPIGMRPMGPPNMRPPPPRGVRPPPPRLPRDPMMQPRMMGAGPRMPPPPPGMRPPPPGMRPPPPHMMGMPPGPPPMRGMGFRRGTSMNRNRKFPMGFKGVQKGRIMKKRKVMIKDLDLGKQWVTDAIKEEFKKKDELLTKAKKSGPDNKEAWAAYRIQREKCSQMYHAAEMEFVGQQEQMEEIEWELDEDFDEELSEVLICDVCEEDFYSELTYQQHISQHKICGLDGCQYTAHPMLIEKHIETQHLTGLYEKIRNISTPEEISKWIEERKVKYPTKENVKKRYEMQQEKLKRGEKIGERKNRFGKNKNRLSTIKQKKSIKKRKSKLVKVEEKPPKSLIDEKCDWNGSMFPFRGTKDLYNEKEENRCSDYDDEEWSMEVSNEVSIKLNNALGALMGAYESDNEDELPIEEKIQRHPIEYPNEELKEAPIKETKKRKSNNNNKKVNKKNKLDNQKTSHSGLTQVKFFKHRTTLLEKLLDSEIRHERNILLQCVQYVVSNNFFRNDT